VFGGGSRQRALYIVAEGQVLFDIVSMIILIIRRYSCRLVMTYLITGKGIAVTGQRMKILTNVYDWPVRKRAIAGQYRAANVGFMATLLSQSFFNVDLKP
jgi:hypothetical protein